MDAILLEADAFVPSRACLSAEPAAAAAAAANDRVEIKASFVSALSPGFTNRAAAANRALNTLGNQASPVRVLLVGRALLGMLMKL